MPTDTHPECDVEGCDSRAVVRLLDEPEPVARRCRGCLEWAMERGMLEVYRRASEGVQEV